MAEFVEQVVLNGDRAMLHDEDARQAVKGAIERSRSREPYLDCRFSQRDVNRGFTRMSTGG